MTKQTLKKNYEFRNVLSRGTYYKGHKIDIYIKKNRRNENYIGIAVGVKVAKATKRNRAKRLIRENYRLLREKLEKGYDIVFLWKKSVPIEKATFQEIKEDMITIFQKAKLY